MRLYKISTSLSGDDDGRGPAKNLVKFVGSQAEAAAARKVFTDSGAKRKDIESVEVDVPTNKEGLLAFLNGLAA